MFTLLSALLLTLLFVLTVQAAPPTDEQHAKTCYPEMPAPRSPARGVDPCQSFVLFWKRIYRAFDIHAKSAAPIYKGSRTKPLPLYVESVRILSDIRAGDVISLGCDTGSGKSTLLPALLQAEGFDNICVTQPRRLPCKLVSRRVSDMFGDLAGWCVLNCSFRQSTRRHRLVFTTATWQAGRGGARECRSADHLPDRWTALGAAAGVWPVVHLSLRSHFIITRSLLSNAGFGSVA